MVYDYLVVGAGLTGSTIAHELANHGKSVLVIERRNHVGGNCWSYVDHGIDIHAYGPHVLHTNNDAIWDYFKKFCSIARKVVSPIANYRGELFNLPFNMNTFHALWGTNTPCEARAIIESQLVPCENPENLEQYVLSMAGRDIYQKLVKGYVEKQYGKPCTELPVNLISRMSFSYEFNNDYLRKTHQGIPTRGYESMFFNMLNDIDVRLNVDYLRERSELDQLADKVIYTGPIDEYYDYCFGSLEYRGRMFDHCWFESDNVQGCAMMNYTSHETEYLRTIEHRHFIEKEGYEGSVVSFEYATEWRKGDEVYYPFSDDANLRLYKRYQKKSENESSVIFAGRCGTYRYMDMGEAVAEALEIVKKLLDLEV